MRSENVRSILRRHMRSDTISSFQVVPNCLNTHMCSKSATGWLGGCGGHFCQSLWAPPMSAYVGPARMHESPDMYAQMDATFFTNSSPNIPTCQMHRCIDMMHRCQTREITLSTFLPKCCPGLPLSSRLVLEVRALLTSESPAKDMRLSLALSKPCHDGLPTQRAGT